MSKKRKVVIGGKKSNVYGANEIRIGKYRWKASWLRIIVAGNSVEDRRSYEGAIRDEEYPSAS